MDAMSGATRTGRPDWLRVRLPSGDEYFRLKGIVRSHRLNTVCEEARCPNVAECWGQGTATFMILGDVCTRACGFCAVTTGLPRVLDRDEPERVADAVVAMGLAHAVVTSVNRDELRDGGASMFAATITAIRRRDPNISVEVLIPDFKGSRSALEAVLAARPDILNHNVETVPRLYKRVRPGASYRQSLELLRRTKEIAPGMVNKTGIMVGLGESTEEVLDVMRDLVREARLDILTIGQYLKPTRDHLEVARFVHPDEFRELSRRGMEMGFRHVEAGPLVRSSYHAASQLPVHP
jgi:lipoic acid synthetase